MTDEWMDPNHVMVVLTQDERRTVWDAVTKERRRLGLLTAPSARAKFDLCSAVRAKLAITSDERTSQ